MSEENVRAFRDAMDAYNRGDKRAWTNLMDPELETVPLPEWPESGPFIGPDAAWDFYKHFEEMLPTREAYEITELIDAGDSLIACHEAPMRGRASAAGSASSSGPYTRFATVGSTEHSGSTSGARPSKPPGCRSRT